jgi:two-component system sensor histidine kinase and response regulator WspE
MPDEREAVGKPRKGTITLGARHTSGYLIISVSDDGRGIDVEALRQSIVRKGFLTEELAANLSKEEIYEFLFLPRFSTKEKVTTISGRGVGLDVVFNMVHAVGGTIRVESVFGKGSTFSMQLPLSLSVINSLIVQINGELYAIPTSKIERIVHVPKTDLHYSDKKLYFKIEDMGKDVNMPLVSANTILNVNAGNTNFDDTLSVLIMGDLHSTYGVVVESVVKQLEHAVMPLNPRLGNHIPLVSAGAILEDGTPCLVIDVADMLRAIDAYFQSNLTINIRPKRILVVDDSITVRELERKLLEKAGYDVTLAIDGVDGLNTAHRESFDMVISDIDMPRMDGIALVKRLRTDAKYTDIPIMIVSYKDREEDKIAGKNAGADYYLTKSSFGDDSFIQAVEDLIGKPV